VNCADVCKFKRLLPLLLLLLLLPRDSDSSVAAEKFTSTSL
jgi:hypothetical protein